MFKDYPTESKMDCIGQKGTLSFSRLNSLGSFQENGSEILVSKLSQWLKGVTGELTSVSGARTNVYFFTISMRAILASMRANLIPMQLRGPQPKGMWQTLGRFAFSSGVNLREQREEGKEELINHSITGRKNLS